MTVFLFIVAFVVLLFTLILISPIRLVIDSNSNTYYVSWKGIASAQLISENKDLIIRIKTLVYKKDFSPLKYKKKEKKEKKGMQKSESKKSGRITFQKMKRMLQSFTIRAFYLNLDTDNYIINGYLYPFFHFVDYPNKSMKINYVGKNDVQLIVENRLYKIINAYLF